MRTAGELLPPVLADLAAVTASITPGQLTAKTPCADYDVRTLQTHVTQWLTYFAIALEDPQATTDRPKPETIEVADDEATAMIGDAAARVTKAIDEGVADGPVVMVEMAMPGEQFLQMMLWEYLMHGSDLAKATGQPWQPADEAAQNALAFAPNMLTDEYRGEGKDFAVQVAVEDDAPALHKLLGFSGRNPTWSA